MGGGCSSVSAVIGIAPDVKYYQRKPKLAGELTLEGVADYILKGNVKNIVWMSGAGVSVSAGIPDFRTPGTGLYSKLRAFDLPTPESMFDIDYFRKSHRPFYTLARTLYPGMFKPTKTHFFIKLLCQKKLLRRNWTQNIDMLERIAGIPESYLVEAHGTFNTARCIECNKRVDPVVVKKLILACKIPFCRSCEGLLKPDIVFFGEPMPQRVEQLMKKDFEDCDLLIVAGTSLQVQPFAKLIESVPKSTPRLLINRERVGVKEMPDNDDSLTDGFNFASANNYRDVFVQGDCDNTIGKLAEMLGWKEELWTLQQQFSMSRGYVPELARVGNAGRRSPKRTKPKRAMRKPSLSSPAVIHE